MISLFCRQNDLFLSLPARIINKTGLSCLRSGASLISLVSYLKDNLHHFQDSLNYGVNIVLFTVTSSSKFFTENSDLSMEPERARQNKSF